MCLILKWESRAASENKEANEDLRWWKLQEGGDSESSEKQAVQR